MAGACVDPDDRPALTGAVGETAHSVRSREGKVAGEGCGAGFAASQETPMTLSTSIRTMIGTSGVTRADEPSDPLTAILRELFRLAHRASDRRNHVAPCDSDSRTTLSVLDHGSGIDTTIEQGARR